MKENIAQAARQVLQGHGESTDGVYPRSVRQCPDGWVFAYRDTDEDFLVALGECAAALPGEHCELDGTTCTVAGFTHESALFLRKHFAFTAPVPVLGRARSIGTGDRLGIATQGHIDAVSDYDVYPVFAQQSMRELKLTGRTYEAVLDDVTFAVYCEGFERGYGADGDHLKTETEIQYALDTGYTMITLDCSEHIDSRVAAMTDDEVDTACTLSEDIRMRYLGQTLNIGPNVTLSMNEATLKRAVLIYGGAIGFAVKVYAEYIAAAGREVDFEISIDETATPTLPEHHFFVASELIARQVKMKTIAPRFCGEFQKGVDYIGDLKQFEQELRTHAAIADHFGYKLSVHSGSDKFSVFIMVGKATKGRFHLKTAGTSWLEAMKLVAIKDPALYREIHRFALGRFAEATKLYHVTTDLNKIPDVDALRDEELPELFSNNDARQLIHITYGYILTEKSGDGSTLFAQRLYKLWRMHYAEYRTLLRAHIGRHLALLYEGTQEDRLGNS